MSGLLINHGLFVVIEGPDLAGKSEFSHRIEAALKALSLDVIWTTEPWREAPTGVAIYEHLMPGQKYPITPYGLQELFRINRREHLRHIIHPALAEGKAVISDRYIPSTIAYGKADGVEESDLWEMNAGFPSPDLVFFLQVGDEEARRRAAARQDTARLSRFDADPEFQKRVRMNYWEMWQHEADRVCRVPGNLIMLNGEESREEISRQAGKHLLSLAAAR